MTGASRWRKKPVVIEAIQWTGDNDDEVEDVAGIRADNGDPVFIRIGSRHTRAAVLWTEKSKRYCQVQPGSWIIAESDGEGFYPCTGVVFAATYEAVPGIEYGAT